MNYYKLAFFLLLGALLAFTGCKTEPSLAFVQRAKDPWIVRSVLDNKPRMLSLALDSNMYVAYDLEKVVLYKVWKGGIRWTGAAYTNEKNIQPESWGHSYFEDPLSTSTWSIKAAEQTHPAKARFHSYQEKKGHLFLRYSIFDELGDTVFVTERPEFVRRGTEVGLERNFRIKPNKQGIVLEQKSEFGSFTLPEGSFERTNMHQEVGVIKKPSKNGQYDHLGRIWLDRSGCNTCHEMEEQTIGPSYKQIAGKYTENEENYLQLISKVQLGGSGVWGEVPMSPHPDLGDSEVKTMLSYIFTLEKQRTGKRRSKQPPRFGTVPGFGAPLEAVHPSLNIQEIRPRWFKPRVGGMDMDGQGNLYLTSWDSIGAVYKLSGLETGDSSQVNIQQVASGLHEPLGLKVVDGDIYVMQKSELSQLLDEDEDGIIDRYNSYSNSFHSSADFHEYNYGLVYKDGYFYANLGIAMRLLSHQRQHPDRGTSIKISPDGSFETLMTGLRQPNGIGVGLGGEIVLTENQGRWVPACKLIVLKPGTFQGCKKDQGDRFDHLTPSPPALWMPHHEIGNSPGQPILIPEGLYKDQLLIGEVTHGGLKRVFLEKVGGEWQGVIFRFSQGLEAGINRMVYGPDGALYVGGVGMNGNWGWQGKRYGLQKLVSSGKKAFEMLSVKARKEGLEIEFTEELSPDNLPKAKDLLIQQWRYEATENYGGPKIDIQTLKISSLEISSDKRSMNLTIPHVTEGYVVYIRLPENLASESGKSLWTGEAWYTLNKIPE